MSKRVLFDAFRQKWVAATPEEMVRQQLLHKMVGELHYPKELISVEVSLSQLARSVGGLKGPFSRRRADIVCFSSLPTLSPLLLIECKEESLSESVKEQVIGYNHHVRSLFIGIASQKGVEVGFFDQKKGEYCFIDFLPAYPDLLKWKSLSAESSH